jgi:hypothetical protein
LKPSLTGVFNIEVQNRIRAILASVAILSVFVAFMFLYPIFYDLLGRIGAMSLWLVLIVFCEVLWNFIRKTSKTGE